MTEEAAESAVWRDTPSQWKEWPGYLGATLLLVALIGFAIVSYNQSWPAWTTWAFVIAQAVPVMIIAWTFAKVATTRYELTSERIRETVGVISRDIESIELYRVKDIDVKRTPAQMILGCANITLHTSDSTRPTLNLEWMSGYQEKVETIRTNVEKCRLRHRARVVEFEGEEDFDGSLT